MVCDGEAFELGVAEALAIGEGLEDGDGPNSV